MHTIFCIKQTDFQIPTVPELYNILLKIVDCFWVCATLPTFNKRALYLALFPGSPTKEGKSLVDDVKGMWINLGAHCIQT